jgi:hypothetical protein
VSRRDEMLARLADRTPRGGRTRGRVAAVVLGWLVLMTIWGFGRAWHGGLAPMELAVGLLAGTAAAVTAWRRSGRGD